MPREGSCRVHVGAAERGKDGWSIWQAQLAALQRASPTDADPVDQALQELRDLEAAEFASHFASQNGLDFRAPLGIRTRNLRIKSPLLCR